MYTLYFLWTRVISNKTLYERKWTHELIEVTFKLINCKVLKILKTDYKILMNNPWNLPASINIKVGSMILVNTFLSKISML